MPWILLRSALVLVVAAPPDARLVASLRCAVEPLVHAPKAVESARIGGIGMVDDAVLERERAHARPLARVRGRVGSAHGRECDCARADFGCVSHLRRVLELVTLRLRSNAFKELEIVVLRHELAILRRRTEGWTPYWESDDSGLRWG